MDKPKDLIKPFFSLSNRDAGQNSQAKINKVKNILLKNKADYLFVTAPENVAWILNIRGYDSEFSPIPNARLLINSKGNVDLFSQSKKFIKIKIIYLLMGDTLFKLEFSQQRILKFLQYRKTFQKKF